MKFSRILLFVVLGASYLFGVVNLNTATKEELMSIKGIGSTKAEAIIEYRKTNKFNSIEDIKNVKGIGDSTFEKIKSELSTSGKTDVDMLNTKEKTSKNIKEVNTKYKSNIKEKNEMTKDKATKKTDEVKYKTKVSNKTKE